MYAFTPMSKFGTMFFFSFWQTFSDVQHNKGQKIIENLVSHKISGIDRSYVFRRIANGFQTALNSLVNNKCVRCKAVCILAEVRLHGDYTKKASNLLLKPSVLSSNFSYPSEDFSKRNVLNSESLTNCVF